MSDVLISIKPKYVEKILSRQKLFEFRTKVCKKKIERLYIYSSYPVKKVVGYAIVSKIICDTPENLWKQTADYAGISKIDYLYYFRNREMAFAYVLDEIKIFHTPKLLSDFGIKKPPQNFLYL